jgi:hypothetical protein
MPMPTLRALALAALLAAACRGGDGDPKGKAGRGVATEVTASDLYRDYSKLRGTDLLDTYAGGVVVTGTVAQATELDEEGLQIWLTVDRGGIALAFADLGAAAREKGIRPGAPLRARCQVAGKPQDTLFLTACTLQ